MFLASGPFLDRTQESLKRKNARCWGEHLQIRNQPPAFCQVSQEPQRGEGVPSHTGSWWGGGICAACGHDLGFPCRRSQGCSQQVAAQDSASAPWPVPMYFLCLLSGEAELPSSLGRTMGCSPGLQQPLRLPAVLRETLAPPLASHLQLPWLPWSLSLWKDGITFLLTPFGVESGQA